jgi:hypothetical protein
VRLGGNKIHDRLPPCLRELLCGHSIRPQHSIEATIIAHTQVHAIPSKRSLLYNFHSGAATKIEGLSFYDENSVGSEGSRGHSVSRNSSMAAAAAATIFPWPRAVKIYTSGGDASSTAFSRDDSDIASGVSSGGAPSHGVGVGGGGLHFHSVCLANTTHGESDPEGQVRGKTDRGCACTCMYALVVWCICKLPNKRRLDVATAPCRTAGIATASFSQGAVRHAHHEGTATPFTMWEPPTRQLSQAWNSHTVSKYPRPHLHLHPKDASRG